ncbi:cytoplasmic protein, partial [Butyriboletus roseoflavus]
MVLFFASSAVNPPATIYMGKDKVENEDLIKYAWPQDVWFHVDKLSSAHVYLRMSEGMTWEAIPQALLTDCAQLLVRKKQGDMAVGQVSFHSDKRVKRIHVPKRENPIVNRLNKTKIEKVIDHEQEKIDRVKKENARKHVAAAQRKKEEAELAKQREEEKTARSYDLLFNVEEDPDVPKLTGKAIEEEFM